MNRENAIEKWRKARVESGEGPIPCIFQITTPKLLKNPVENNEVIKQVLALLDKYQITWKSVDTVEGSFNLNRTWLETADIPCYIEYCGVYPAEWDVKDVAILESLERNGEIITRVVLHPEKDYYVPNH